MVNAQLDPVGSDAHIDVDLCVKTGERTNEQVILQGRTFPRWVNLLLLLTVVGFILGTAITSRRYNVTVPFKHAAYDHWRKNRRWAWGTGLTGVAAIVVGATADSSHSGRWAWAGVVLVTVALGSGLVNQLKHQVGVRLRDGNELLLTRVHPEFARAVQEASTEVPPGRPLRGAAHRDV